MAASTAPWSVVDVESFINEYYGAWSGTDEDRIMSYYAENVVLQIPGAFMEGKEAVRDQFVRPFITAFPGNHHRVKNMVFGPGVITVEWSFEAQHKGPFGGHAATGARIKLPGCGVYEYDSANRQITAGRIYFDVGTLLQTITDLPVNEKAAEALHLNERNLSLIINTIPTTAWTTRPDGYCDFLNQRWLDYAGMTAEQAAGWGWAEAIHPDDRKRLVEYWQSCLASGVPVEAEARMRRFDGSYRWFLFRANPVRDESGKIVKWYGTNIDIEDRKRGEEAMRASELSWRQIVDNIPGLVATTGAMGEVEFLNRQTLEYFGKTNEELKDWALIDAVIPDDLPRVIEARKKSIEAGQIYEVEHRCRRADGVYRWFQVRGLPVRNTEGTITAWYLLLTDIDDLKKAEEALQSSERNLSLTINTIPTFIQVSRPDGTVLSVNQAVLDYHGITLQDVQKEDFRSRFYHPDDAERLREERKEALKRPLQFEYEQRALGKDGKYRWFLVRYNPLLDDQGRIDRWYATAFDIEDRKRAECEREQSQEALRNALDEIQKSESKLRQVIDTIPTLAWCNLPDGPNEFLSKPWHEYTGLSPEESQGWGWQAAFHPEDLPPLMERWVKMLASGEPDEIEARLRRHDGVYRWFLIRAEPFRDESGKIVRWYGTSTDIDDRKRAEEALQSNERNLTLIINTMPTLAWSALPDGSVDFVNQRWLDYTSLSPEQALGWGWTAAIHPDDLNDLADYWQSIMHTGEPGETEARFRRFDGEYRWFLFRANAVRDESGTIVKWYGTNTDIDDRKRAEAQVEQAYLRLAQAQRLSKTGSFITDLLADEHNWSEELCRIFEFDPGTRVTTDAIRAVFHPEDLPVYEDAFKRAVDGRDRDIDIIYRIITPSGNVKHLHAVAHVMEKIAGRPVYIGAIQDVTERKVAEEALTRARSELAHMARVTTLSALTASIAHEINQPIAAAITSAGACLRWLNRDQPEVQRAREAAMRIEDDGKRASEIITHLKSFYKKDVSPQREMVSVNDLVGEMLVLLRSESDRHSVVMSTELAADLPSVSADRVQLQQVLMNLMLNGMEAMSERGGELKISTRRDAGEVMVSVSDIGVGIPADQMEEIFNAFVTTKAGGTGMGLAISRTILESHGGRLWAAVNLGRGATFHFTLQTEPEANK
jgi:PAS domain S-box-containing protein